VTRKGVVANGFYPVDWSLGAGFQVVVQDDESVSVVADDASRPEVGVSIVGGRSVAVEERCEV